MDAFSVDFGYAYILTPLMMACSRGHTEIIECLIRNGVDVSVVDEDGTSALHYAVPRQSFDDVMV